MRLHAFAPMLAVAAAAAGGANAQVGTPPPLQPPIGTPTYPLIKFHKSRSVGKWFDGRLIRAVQLPAEGPDFFTYDGVKLRRPDRGWRRWGHDRMIRTLLAATHTYRAKDPGAGRVGIGDISRRHGGWFGARYGGLGHDSHQVGLDVDVYYPRKDGLEKRAKHPWQIDRPRARALLRTFLRFHPKLIFVGPHTGLRGPPKIVQKLAFHDDHMHVRLRIRRSGR
jgi:murein endopeptidase